MRIRGVYGIIPFMVSSSMIETFDKLTQSWSGNWLESKPIGGQPKVIFNGPQLDTIKMTVLAKSQLGVKPMLTKKVLELYLENGLKMPLLLPDYRGMYVLESFSADEKAWGKWGIANTVEFTLNLKKYH